MWTFGPRRNNNIYWYVKRRVVVPLMSLVVLVNFEVGCWKIYRHVWNSVCILANNKNQKQEPKTDKSCSYLSALFDQTQTQWVSFFPPHLHTIPPYMSAQFPTVPLVTLAKVLDEKRTGRKTKMGTKRWKLFFCSEGAEGLSVMVFRKKLQEL